MDEIGEVMEYVQEAAGSTDIILGTCDDPLHGEKLSVTIIATGFEVGAKTAVYKEQKVVKVYELNDKAEVVKEETVTPEVKADAPAIIIDEPVVEKVEEETPVVATLELEQEEFSLFAQLEETEVSDNVFEFSVSREEQTLPEPEVNLVEEEAVVEENITAPETVVEVQKVEDDFKVYTVKSYESEVAPQEEMTNKLEDRKKVLASLSYRVGHKQKIDELEHEPAYKRKGLDLNTNQNYSTATDYSRYSVGNDDLDRPEIKKNNSFLHDNVD